MGGDANPFQRLFHRRLRRSIKLFARIIPVAETAAIFPAHAAPLVRVQHCARH